MDYPQNNRMLHRPTNRLRPDNLLILDQIPPNGIHLVDIFLAVLIIRATAHSEHRQQHAL
jgi:hypothetical protein